MDIGIVGAGAAGIVTAKELMAKGHRVTLFEKSGNPGGIWRYTEAVDSDPLGVLGGGSVHSSLYASLRTNLPRDLMAFSDFTFDSSGGGEDDWPRYPHHTLVQQYLDRYATAFAINDHTRFHHTVTEIVPRAGRWVIQAENTGVAESAVFDAVAVCTGHYSKPRVPALPGASHFSGRFEHSHNYRREDAYRDQRVALWGAAASGADISREISSVARHVIWCGDAFNDDSYPRQISEHFLMAPSPAGFSSEGQLCFADGSCHDIDTFMYCTGYEYQFPFLSNDIVAILDNVVHPLYLDIIPPHHPTLAFIGIPYLVVPFPLFQMQARWFAATLDERASLPSAEDMMQSVRDHQRSLRNEGVLPRHFHKLGDKQTAYYNRLAAEAGEPPLPDWFITLANEAQNTRLRDPRGFRDARLSTRGPTRVTG